LVNWEIDMPNSTGKSFVGWVNSEMDMDMLVNQVGTELRASNKKVPSYVNGVMQEVEELYSW
jgi:hypothetical protein